MKIRLLSDLHTEFGLKYKTEQFSEYRGEDVVVLAGDIASGSTNTAAVLKHFAVVFPHVVYVAGNHEYYGTEYHKFNTSLHKKCEDLPNVHFLHRNSVLIRGVLFIGATLWTNFNNDFTSIHAAKNLIADFRLIKGFTPQHAIDEYHKDYEYIKLMYESTQKPKVIVTHFLPAKECISPQFLDDRANLNNYFANDLGNWISEMENTTWMFGHTHDTIDRVIGSTRVVANPRGYCTSRYEGMFFDPFKTIEI